MIVTVPGHLLYYFFSFVCAGSKREMTYNIFRVKMAEKVPSPLKYSIPKQCYEKKKYMEVI